MLPAGAVSHVVNHCRRYCRPRSDEVSASPWTAYRQHDGVMLANIGVHDEAHRGFRAIHKMNNIRSLSEVIWGHSQVMRWRHCWQVGTTSGQ